MTRLSELANIAYAYSEQHYNDKDARFDVMVETMSLADIERELQEQNISTERAAIAYAKRMAGLQFEQELNQAWDGPESVRSSSRYDPAHDPAGPPLTDEEMREAMLPDFVEHIDSYTGYPHYTAVSERAREQMRSLRPEEVDEQNFNDRAEGL